jgi:hypothetical protein
MSTLPEERSQVAVLEDITADELNGLERAASHTVERHVQGWRDRLATAGADDTVLGAVDDYIRLTDRSRVGVRRLVASVKVVYERCAILVAADVGSGRVG